MHDRCLGKLALRATYTVHVQVQLLHMFIHRDSTVHRSHTSCDVLVSCGERGRVRAVASKWPPGPLSPLFTITMVGSAVPAGAMLSPRDR